MLWFIGGYVLVAVAFYSYITMTSQEDPDSIEQEYAFSSTNTGENNQRKVA